MDEVFELTDVNGATVLVTLTSILEALAAEVGSGQRDDLRSGGDPVEIRSRVVDGFRVVVELRR